MSAFPRPPSPSNADIIPGCSPKRYKDGAAAYPSASGIGPALLFVDLTPEEPVPVGKAPPVAELPLAREAPGVLAKAL